MQSGADVYHGTHVAGTAAAIDNNSIGVPAWRPTRGSWPCASSTIVIGTSDDIASGIAYAAQQGADVINLSLGGPGSDPSISNAVDVANSSNAVVAAAGNESLNNDEFPEAPCVLPQANLICVASIDNNGLRSGLTTAHDRRRGRSRRRHPQHPGNRPARLPVPGRHLHGRAACLRRRRARAGIRPRPTPRSSRPSSSVRRLPSLVGDTSTGGLVDSGAAIRRARAFRSGRPGAPRAHAARQGELQALQALDPCEPHGALPVQLHRGRRPSGAGSR